MTQQANKVAENYVKAQLQSVGGKVATRDVKRAIRRVAAVLEEIRAASAAHERASRQSEPA